MSIHVGAAHLRGAPAPDARCFTLAARTAAQARLLQASRGAPPGQAPVASRHQTRGALHALSTRPEQSRVRQGRTPMQAPNKLNKPEGQGQV